MGKLYDVAKTAAVAGAWHNCGRRGMGLSKAADYMAKGTVSIAKRRDEADKVDLSIQTKSQGCRGSMPQNAMKRSG